MAAGLAALAALAGFAALTGLLSFPTGTGGSQLARLLLSSRQLGFQLTHNSTGLGGSFHGSLSHHTITHRKDNRKRKEFYLNPRERYNW